MPRLDADRVAAWRAFGVVAADVQRKVEAGLVDDYHPPPGWFEILASLSAERAPSAWRVASARARAGRGRVRGGWGMCPRCSTSWRRACRAASTVWRST